MKINWDNINIHFKVCIRHKASGRYGMCTVFEEGALWYFGTGFGIALQEPLDVTCWEIVEKRL